MWTIVIIFSVFTLIVPYILNIPSDFDASASIIPGVVVLASGTAIMMIGKLKTQDKESFNICLIKGPFQTVGQLSDDTHFSHAVAIEIVSTSTIIELIWCFVQTNSGITSKEIKNLQCALDLKLSIIKKGSNKALIMSWITLVNTKRLEPAFEKLSQVGYFHENTHSIEFHRIPSSFFLRDA